MIIHKNHLASSLPFHTFAHSSLPSLRQTVWKELLLAVIGEQFCEHLGEGDEICGVTVAIRPADSIIELWNKNASESNSTRILRRIQEVLGSNIEIRTPYYKINREHLAFGAVANKSH
jgi:hypothetical protein